MDGLLRTYRLVDRAIYDLEALLAGLGLGLSVLVTLVDVCLRNGGELVESVTGIRISGGIGGGGEVAQMSMIWGMLMGAALGSRQGIHIGVDVLVQRLPAPLCKAVVLLTLAVGVLFTAAVAGLGRSMVEFSLSTGQITADAGIPRWMLYAAVPVSMVMMTFHQTQVFVETWRRPADEVKRGAQAVTHDGAGAGV